MQLRSSMAMALLASSLVVGDEAAAQQIEREDVFPELLEERVFPPPAREPEAQRQGQLSPDLSGPGQPSCDLVPLRQPGQTDEMFARIRRDWDSACNPAQEQDR